MTGRPIHRVRFDEQTAADPFAAIDDLPMRMALVALGILLLVVVIVIAIGYTLPQNHTASRERMFRASPDRLFVEISNPAAYPEWRSGVRRVEMLPPLEGRVRFRESSSDGDITFVFESLEPGRRIVTRIADKSLPFGGSWTYELTPTAGGTLLRITENGEVYNPFFRFMSRFVFGYHSSIDKFLDDLTRRVLAA